MPGAELVLQTWHTVSVGRIIKFSAKQSVLFSPSTFNYSTAERSFQVYLYSSQRWKGNIKHPSKINQRVPFTVEPCSVPAALQEHSTHQAEDYSAYLGE